MTKRQQKERLAQWAEERAREHERKAFLHGGPRRAFSWWEQIDINRDEEITADNLREIARLLRNGTGRKGAT